MDNKSCQSEGILYFSSRGLCPHETLDLGS